MPSCDRPSVEAMLGALGAGGQDRVGHWKPIQRSLERVSPAITASRTGSQLSSVCGGRGDRRQDWLLLACVRLGLELWPRAGYATSVAQCVAINPKVLGNFVQALSLLIKALNCKSQH